MLVTRDHLAAAIAVVKTESALLETVVRAKRPTDSQLYDSLRQIQRHLDHVRRLVLQRSGCDN